MKKINASSPTHISAMHLRHHLGEIIHQVIIDKKHFILERNGLPVMAIVPLDEYKSAPQDDETSK